MSFAGSIMCGAPRGCTTARAWGSADAASISTGEPQRDTHLKSPDFFDVENYPELRYEARDVRVEGDELVVDGELTIKGNTHPVEGRGALVGPHEDIAGNTKLGVTLETVIDRTKFGLNWNAELPKGGYALSNDVRSACRLRSALRLAARTSSTRVRSTSASARR